MKWKTFLIIHALFLAFNGLGTLFIPQIAWGMWGAKVDGTFFVRLLGTLMTANAVLSWFFREVTDAKARRAIVYQQLLAWGLALILFVVGQFDGTFAPIGWATVVLGGLFTFGWVYFGFIKPNAE